MMADASVWQVEVDRERCLATRGCVHALPEVFEIGEDDVARVIGAVDGNDEFVQQIVAECPTGALRLRKEKTADDS
jgi:ferredoxin